MNNFKFRVFDKEKNKYVTDDEYFYLNLDGDLLWSKWKNENLIECNPDRFVVEQFTGLLDKNGVDIYEGDIIKIDDNYNMFGQFAGEIREIYFHLGAFRLKPKWDKNAAGNYLEDFEYLTVIGNKHQNPELLGV